MVKGIHQGKGGGECAESDLKGNRDVERIFSGTPWCHSRGDIARSKKSRLARSRWGEYRTKGAFGKGTAVFGSKWCRERGKIMEERAQGSHQWEKGLVKVR